MVGEGRRGVAVDDVVGEEAPAGGGRRRVWGFIAGFRGLGVRMVGGWDGSGEPWLRDTLV